MALYSYGQVVEFQKADFGGALTANVQSHVQLMSRTGKVTDSCYPKSCGPIGAGPTPVGCTLCCIIMLCHVIII